MNGAKIRRLRESLGWSQRELGDYLGIEQATVSRLEADLWPASGPVQRLLDALRGNAGLRKPSNPEAA